MRSIYLAIPCLGILLVGCVADDPASGWRRTPTGTGPLVGWDLEARPLPDIPLPNDVATWPDPTSPTGRRINASLIAPTAFERHARSLFDRLDGWGTFAPMQVSFDAPLDLAALLERHDRRWDFAQHAVYLVHLETGVPVPLDVNGGNFDYALSVMDRYFPNDPRGRESNLYFETVDEDLDQDGVLDPGEDTDYDGVLDRPNTLDGRRTGPLDTYDRMLWFYESQTDTLLLRPVVPLEENTRYAVVLTDRLVDREGAPVRSPFAYVHHFAQREDLAGLAEHFQTHATLYGDLGERGWEGVAFAWSFTTQSVTRDLVALREGLYGRGMFARLADEFPAALNPTRLRVPCADPGPTPYIATVEQIGPVLKVLAGRALGLSDEATDIILNTYRAHVSHFVFAFFETPYLLGDPEKQDLRDAWDMDAMTGQARIRRGLVPMLITVPKTTSQHKAPFPVTLYAHGKGNNVLESLGFVGLMASHGVATVALDAPENGLVVSEVLGDIARGMFNRACLGGFAEALLSGRARDINGDGMGDSAALTFTAAVFRSRDTLRQGALDYMQALRILRSFDGQRRFVPGTLPRASGAPFVFDADTNVDAQADLAGDFDGDGVVDVGGPDGPYFMWGQSLGGLMTGITAGIEPMLTASVPLAAGGGLSDIALRSIEGGLREAINLRAFGPLLVALPVQHLGAEGLRDSTACQPGQSSLRFVIPDGNTVGETEVACLLQGELLAGDTVVLENLTLGKESCAGSPGDGRFRLAVPADTGDRLRLRVYRATPGSMDFADCRFPSDVPSPTREVYTFEVAPGDECSVCARYQGSVFVEGEPLVSPTEGLALIRQTPDMRRFGFLAQTALEPGDPINYAPLVFLRPRSFADVPPHSRSLLMLNTAGDQNVPVSTGNAYARAAGLLPFLPAVVPEDALSEYRAPLDFRARYGAFASPNELLMTHHVFEGIARLKRHPADPSSEVGADFLVDPDDLDDGTQLFSASGAPQRSGEEMAWAPQRIDPPLRLVRASQSEDKEGGPLWNPAKGVPMSGVLNAMVRATGKHALDLLDGGKIFDDSTYLTNLIGVFFRSLGTDLRYHTDPLGHRCSVHVGCEKNP